MQNLTKLMCTIITVWYGRAYIGYNIAYDTATSDKVKLSYENK